MVHLAAAVSAEAETDLDVGMVNNLAITTDAAGWGPSLAVNFPALTVTPDEELADPAATS